MLYSGLARINFVRYLERNLRPLRAGFIYGIGAAVIALASDFYFLYVDPAGTPSWVLAVIQAYHTQIALTAFLFLGILAALAARPDHLDPGVPYRSLLLRDSALAATLVAVMVGVVLFFATALQATVFADQASAYARVAAPKIVSYSNTTRQDLIKGRIKRGETPEQARKLPPPAKLANVRGALNPPSLAALGRSIMNLVLRCLLLGGAGAVVGLLRGRSDQPDEMSYAGAAKKETNPPER